MGRRVTWKSGGETHLTAHQDIPEEEEGMLRGGQEGLIMHLLRSCCGKGPASCCVVSSWDLGPPATAAPRQHPAQVKGGKSQVLGLCISYSTTNNHPCQLMVMVSDTPGTTVLL